MKPPKNRAASITKAKSSAPVWAKGKNSNADPADAALCVAYCAGRDVTARPMADAALIPWDLLLNRAHCAMLADCKIISPAQLAAIARGLDEIERRHLAGKFALDPALEDVHINIERAVAAISGESAAGVMHTARSRNDQTTTDSRLFIRDRLLHDADSLAETVAELARFAARHAGTVMAGWTHGQPAMPTSLGHWAAAHGSALERDLAALIALWPVINQSPLGAAAGFGTAWPIDRHSAARWLGFDAAQDNSLDCVSTRWEMEARFGSALSIMMTHLSSLGQDLYFLSSPPRRFVLPSPAFTTGSSIMPQKRNPDFAEVTRARATAVESLLGAIGSVGRGALSGYNRDTQWTKYWIMDLAEEVGEAPRVFARVMATLQVDAGALAQSARQDFISAVDLADHLAATRKIEFRRLYHLIGEAVTLDREKGAFRLETLNELLAREQIHPAMAPTEWDAVLDPRRTLDRRGAFGGPEPDQVERQSKDLLKGASEAKRWVAARRAALSKSRAQLDSAIRTLAKRSGR